MADATICTDIKRMHNFERSNVFVIQKGCSEIEASMEKKRMPVHVRNTKSIYSSHSQNMRSSSASDEVLKYRGEPTN